MPILHIKHALPFVHSFVTFLLHHIHILLVILAKFLHPPSRVPSGIARLTQVLAKLCCLESLFVEFHHLQKLLIKFRPRLSSPCPSHSITTIVNAVNQSRTLPTSGVAFLLLRLPMRRRASNLFPLRSRLTPTLTPQGGKCKYWLAVDGSSSDTASLARQLFVAKCQQGPTRQQLAAISAKLQKV